MSGPTGAGERIEVQYTLEDEVLIIDHLDDPPEDFGEALALTLGADDAADGKRPGCQSGNPAVSHAGGAPSGGGSPASGSGP